MKSRIINVKNASIVKVSHGDRFEAEIAAAGRDVGSKKLGFNVTTIPPGKRSFPYHAHRGNEEIFFVLEGEGSVRIAGETHKIRPGDFISLPPGKDSAHQIVNDSGAPLRVLAVSTMELPEVVEYPDSGKIVVTAGAFPWAGPHPEALRYAVKVEDAVDYWEGE